MMKFNVKIHTESTIEELDDSGLAESSDRAVSDAVGTMMLEGKKISLSYTESSAEARINTEITVENNTVYVKRRGDAQYDFVFREGERTAALYSIPPYSFDAEIYTKRLRCSLCEGGGELSLLYDMTLGGAKKKTIMKIRVSPI